MTNLIEWRHPDTRGPLVKGKIHIWRIQLSEPGWQQRHLLSAEEIIREEKIQDSRQTIRYLGSRVAVRLILAGYLDRKPESLTFKVTKKGKPYLSNPNSGLEFNLTHTADQALLAVALHPVGIDIERYRAIPRLLDIAKRVLPQEDLDALMNSSKDKQPGLFFSLWTRFEAQLKAQGLGVFDRTSQECQVLGFLPDTEHIGAIAWIETDQAETDRPGIHFIKASADSV